MNPHPPKSRVKTTAPDEAASPATTSEIRKHYFLDRYVVIAPKRKLRPDSFADDKSLHNSETKTSPAIERDPAVFELTDSAGRWQVKVIDNAFPALSLDNPKAYGKQELVIETPKHNTEFSQLPVEQIERIFDCYIARERELAKLPGIKYVSIFKNDGPKAGASIAHAHSQIVAWPLIPPDVEAEARVVEAYRSTHGTCAHCDVISWERRQKVRIIAEDEHIVAVSPYATRVPFGAWLMPKTHRTNFAELTPGERRSLAAFIKKMTISLDHSKISFNFFLQNSLPRYQHHFVLRLEPRVTIWAGGEFSTGIVFNPVSPEYAARWYRGEAR